MDRLKGILMIIIGSISWGATGPIMEWLLSTTEITPSFMLAVRLIIAGTLLLAFLHVKGTNVFAIWRQTAWRNQLLIFSIIGMLGLQFTFVKTIEESNAIVATLLQFLAPIFIILYVSIAHKKWPPKAQVIGIIGTLCGLFLLLTNGSLSSLMVSKTALIWGVAVGFTYAFYTLYPARLMKEWGVLVVVAWGFLLSGVELSIIGRIWATDEWGLLANSTVIWMISGLVIFGTVAFVLFLSSMKYITAIETSVLSSFEPVTATIISVIWLGSVMQMWQVVGIMLMLVFVAYLSIAGKKE
ncbi:DMT family transporter [Lysinibacillus sp. LZ02]|uniref:DMT family transporter n=1 Tax=Lysinibacillus sp. LZ02 TaxID=3420668 RepID=UPI003D36231B